MFFLKNDKIYLYEIFIIFLNKKMFIKHHHNLKKIIEKYKGNVRRKINVLFAFYVFLGEKNTINKYLKAKYIIIVFF